MCVAGVGLSGSNRMAGGRHRIYSTAFADVYPHYITKAERKGRSQAEVDQIIRWLTGYDTAELRRLIGEMVSFEDFFARAQLNPQRRLITGVVCGVRVEDIQEPLMQEIRYLDKLIDELAKGKKMQDIIKSKPASENV